MIPIRISFARAKFHASQYKINEMLYPLFADDPTPYLYNPMPTSAAASRIPQFTLYRPHPCLNTFNNQTNWDRQPYQAVTGTEQQQGPVSHPGHHYMSQHVPGAAPGIEMNTRAVGLLSHQEHGGSLNSPNLVHSATTATSSSSPSSNSSSGIGTPIDSASQSPHPGFRQQNGPNGANGGVSQSGSGVHHSPIEDEMYLLNSSYEYRPHGGQYDIHSYVTDLPFIRRWLPPPLLPPLYSNS